jgi:hypothetical protein
MKTGLRTLAVLALMGLGTLFAGYGGAPRPITALGKEADVIVLATATSVRINKSETTATLVLRIVGTLKRQTGAGSVPATVDLSGNSAQFVSSSEFFEKSVTGSSGVWFLRLDQAGYHVIPFNRGPVQPEYLFLREDPRSLAAVPAGTLNRQLLALVVKWYQGLTAPGLDADTRLLSSFHRGNPSMSDVSVSDLLLSANDLIGSAVQSQHVIGLALALQLGSASALTEVVTELDDLKGDAKFAYVVNAVATYSQGPESIPILIREIALHTDAPGMDDAVASALSRMMNNRSVVPAMATLLGSRDTTAQLRAARFFAVYSLLCDARGNIVEGAADGPLASDETRSFSPGADVNKTPDQCVQFWKQWWVENGAKLGFRAP